jgi:hypothetical protein
MPNTVTLGPRALNRALLGRQSLLRPAAGPAATPLAVIERLVGMQSQAPGAPYVGVWSRLPDFSFGELSKMMTSRQAVRMVLMRGTVHLVSAADALALRPVLQPALDKQFAGSNWARGVPRVDRAELEAVCRQLVEERPRTPGELREALASRWPDADPASLVNAARSWLPLVQIPPRGLWGESGQVTYTTAEHWLGRPLAEPDPAAVVRRYLAAFGPATVADVQKWSGLSGARGVVSGMEMRTYADEQGRVLYDLPDAPPLPDPDTPVPARMVAEFDNLLLSHADRERVVGREELKAVISINGIVRGTVLIDGFVGGTWAFERGRGVAAVRVESFGSLRRADRDTLTEQGARLLAAGFPGVTHEVRFGPD